MTTATDAAPATDPGTATPPPPASASTVLTGAAATRAARFQRAAAVLDRPAAPAKSAESTAEAASPTTAPTPAEKRNLSSEGVKLKQFERSLAQRAAAVEAAHAEATKRAEALEAERTRHAAELAEWNELKSKSPREAARRLGLTLRDFADEHVRQSESDTARQIRELKERAEAEQKEREERDARRTKELEELRAETAREEARRIERDDREWVNEAWEASSAEFPFLSAYGGSRDVIVAEAYKHTRAEFDKKGTVDRRAILRKMDEWAKEQKDAGNWTEAQLKRFAPKPPPAAPRTAPKRPATRSERLERARRVMKGER